MGKFSIRLVPSMKPKQVETLVQAYLEQKHRDSGSPNSLRSVNPLDVEHFLTEIH